MLNRATNILARWIPYSLEIRLLIKRLVVQPLLLALKASHGQLRQTDNNFDLYQSAQIFTGAENDAVIKWGS
jgi:hypothetical protein